MEPFCERLRRLRKRRGLLQKELGAELGTVGTTISLWECGNRLPHFDYLEPLASALGVTVGYLVTGKTDQD